MPVAYLPSACIDACTPRAPLALVHTQMRRVHVALWAHTCTRTETCPPCVRREMRQAFCASLVFGVLNSSTSCRRMEGTGCLQHGLSPWPHEVSLCLCRACTFTVAYPWAHACEDLGPTMTGEAPGADELSPRVGTSERAYERNASSPILLRKHMLFKILLGSQGQELAHATRGQRQRHIDLGLHLRTA